MTHALDRVQADDAVGHLQCRQARAQGCLAALDVAEVAYPQGGEDVRPAGDRGDEAAFGQCGEGAVDGRDVTGRDPAEQRDGERASRERVRHVAAEGEDTRVGEPVQAAADGGGTGVGVCGECREAEAAVADQGVDQPPVHRVELGRRRGLGRMRARPAQGAELRRVQGAEPPAAALHVEGRGEEAVDGGDTGQRFEVCRHETGERGQVGGEDVDEQIGAAGAGEFDGHGLVVHAQLLSDAHTGAGSAADQDERRAARARELRPGAAYTQASPSAVSRSQRRARVLAVTPSGGASSLQEARGRSWRALTSARSSSLAVTVSRIRYHLRARFRRIRGPVRPQPAQ